MCAWEDRSDSAIKGCIPLSSVLSLSKWFTLRLAKTGFLWFWIGSFVRAHGLSIIHGKDAINEFLNHMLRKVEERHGSKGFLESYEEGVFQVVSR